MKAKEYYEKYLIGLTPENEKEKMWELITAFLAEVVEIQKTRQAKSNSALIAIFREQNQKWNALCKYDSNLKRDGFIEVVKYRFLESPEILFFDKSQIISLLDQI